MTSYVDTITQLGGVVLSESNVYYSIISFYWLVSTPNRHII